jgi:subfamily B ATP-binding cassette protein MsbA
MSTPRSITQDVKADINLYQRLMGYLKPYRTRFMMGVMASIPAASLNGAIAFMVGPVVDQIVKDGNFTVFNLLPLGVIIAAFIQGSCDYLSDYATSYVGTAVSRDLRRELYDHLIKMDLRYFKGHSSGELMTRYYADPGSLQAAIVNNFQSFLLEFFNLIFLAGVLFYRSWTFALMAIAIISLILVPLRVISKKLRNLDHQSNQLLASLYNLFNESVFGAKVIMDFQLQASLLFARRIVVRPKTGIALQATSSLG